MHPGRGNSHHRPECRLQNRFRDDWSTAPILLISPCVLKLPYRPSVYYSTVLQTHKHQRRYSLTPNLPCRRLRSIFHDSCRQLEKPSLAIRAVAMSDVHVLFSGEIKKKEGLSVGITFHLRNERSLRRCKTRSSGFAQASYFFHSIVVVKNIIVSSERNYLYVL